MRTLLSLLGLAVSRAHASTIEQLGAGMPGIDQMWRELKQFFPFTDLGSRGLAFIVLRMINIVLRFIGGIGVLMIVYGGIRMIMTVQSEENATQARNIVLYACIGLILTILADAVVLYVLSVVKLATGG